MDSPSFVIWFIAVAGACLIAVLIAVSVRKEVHEPTLKPLSPPGTEIPGLIMALAVLGWMNIVSGPALAIVLAINHVDGTICFELGFGGILSGLVLLGIYQIGKEVLEIRAEVARITKEKK
ncbi:MAG TPA: hypothetical protein VKS81_10960 [Bacteroidota bacterium]|nr:hypothetical protein [Bacteroidota bacterium]